jgi:hypothetical protein
MRRYLLASGNATKNEITSTAAIAMSNQTHQFMNHTSRRTTPPGAGAECLLSIGPETPAVAVVQTDFGPDFAGALPERPAMRAAFGGLSIRSDGRTVAGIA